MLKKALFLVLVMGTNAQEKAQNFAELYSLEKEVSQVLPERYSEAEGLKGRELFLALHRITGKNYKSHSYGSAKSHMYATVDNVSGKVFAAYSGKFAKKTGKRYLENGDENGDGVRGDFINCEHTWPQSKFGKSLPMVSDVHHLLSTFSKPNGMRGHWEFGIVDGGDVQYKTNYGSELGDKVFEPADPVKGNVARAIMYFYVRYHNRDIFQQTTGEEADNFWFKRVPQFMEWSKNDAPDDWEKSRNDAVEKYQGNRNPFIDYPAFVELIGVDGFRTRAEQLVDDAQWLLSDGVREAEISIDEEK